MITTSSTSLIGALHAEGPASDRADKLNLYGRFVGDWEMDIVVHAPDGGRHEGQGEIHFGWILEGRAIQDVWMIPRRKDRRADGPSMPLAGNWYGTTLRIYDTRLDAWRIYWLDPATNAFRQQIVRPRGADIVQEGTTDDGSLSRWSFTNITPQSFRWTAEAAADAAGPWCLLVDILARRVSS